MLKSGLASISFRAISADELILLCISSGVRAIEWGSDIHVPAGDVKTALRIKEKCSKAGISCPSYGTYFRCGEPGYDALRFRELLDCASALGAETLRVWAGKKSSARADDEYRMNVLLSSRECAEAAAAKGLSVSFEYHPGTLTDCPESALMLLDSLPRESVYTYWQPDFSVSRESNLQALKALLPRLSNVHVFNWDADKTKHLLSDGNGPLFWKDCVHLLYENDRDRYLYLEFLRGNDTKLLKGEKETLDAFLGYGI